MVGNGKEPAFDSLLQLRPSGTYSDSYSRTKLVMVDGDINFNNDTFGMFGIHPTQHFHE